MKRKGKTMDILDKAEKADFDIECASKDELIMYAEIHHQMHLSGKDKLEELKIQVKQMMKEECDPVPEADIKKAKVKGKDAEDYQYCLNPENGRVLIASVGMRRLVKLGDLVPCDKDGKEL